MSDILSTSTYVRQLHDRLLAGDPSAPAEIERLVKLKPLAELTDEVSRHSLLQEFEFASSVPILGKFIARLRSFVHSIASRWALRFVVQQQNRFNRSVARALEASLLLNEHLLARIETLEQRLSLLEQQ
ncbi:MAG: hypothetical protein RMM31_02635 [Anaerolineae bacterium]|nr:hypothetical protein [Thermoflexales bacterium]MDW8395119.1 hypothetical protein [Anaerolineae bacterium]